MCHHLPAKSSAVTQEASAEQSPRKASVRRKYEGREWQRSHRQGLHCRQAVPCDPARQCRQGEISTALPRQWGQGRGRALPGAGGRGMEPLASSMSRCEQCPRCHLSPLRGRSAPWCGDSAGQGTQRAGTGRGDKSDNPRQTPCQGLAMAKGRRQGKGEQLSTTLFPLQIATGTFVKEEDLSKLEKDTTNILKKPQLGKHLPVQTPPPSTHCPSTGKGHGMSGRGKGRLCFQSCPCHPAFGDKGTVTYLITAGEPGQSRAPPMEGSTAATFSD